MKWCCSLALLLAPAVAQEDFDALYRKAEAVPVSDEAGRRTAFAAAYRAFVRIPAQTAAYEKALSRGAWSAFHAGMYGSARPLFAAVMSKGLGGEPVVTAWLTAGLRGGRRREVVEAARQLRAKHERGVFDFLADPRDFVRLTVAGAELLQAGDALGLWLFETQAAAMRGRPGHGFAMANLALAYRQSGEGSKADDTYRAALVLAPRDAVLWSDYGLYLKGVGRFEAAFDAYVKATEVEGEPGASPAGTNLGVLFQRTGKTRGRDPRLDLVRVLRLRPHQALARRLLLDGLSAARTRKPR